MNIKRTNPVRRSPRKPVFEKTFTSYETFGAVNTARVWLRDRGISYGSMAGDMPIGLHSGIADISKWYNMSRTEQSRLDGRMTSPDFREGPVTVTMYVEVVG